jgi:hypothetical protein
MGQERGDDDRRYLAELNHDQNPEITLTTKEALAARSHVPSPVMWILDGPVDEFEVGDGSMLLDDLRVDDRGEDDLDALGSPAA